MLVYLHIAHILWNPSNSPSSYKIIDHDVFFLYEMVILRFGRLTLVEKLSSSLWFERLWKFIFQF